VGDMRNLGVGDLGGVYCGGDLNMRVEPHIWEVTSPSGAVRRTGDWNGSPGPGCAGGPAAVRATSRAGLGWAGLVRAL
jgi:hypothetical protein